MKNQDLYEQLDEDESLSDTEKREIYFSERDEEEDRQSHCSGQESCGDDML